MKRKIVFITGALSQPRIIKRINSFIDNGYEVEVYGFDRGKYSINKETYKCDINIVGEQKDGQNYFAKLIQIYNLHKSLNNKSKSDNSTFYLFGFIEAFFSLFFHYKYIYEISDILYGYNKFKPIEWLIKLVDKIIIKKSILTVMTSEGFEEYFYPNKKYNNIVIQPNKLNSFFNSIDRNNLDYSVKKESIIFSYVGAFRYPNTVFRFAHIIGKNFPQHKFYFYGDSIFTNEVKDIASLYENVKYLGPFKNPNDLMSIYKTIDIVVACYDTKDLNERIAEPNKLYEAMFFKKPIIVSPNTFLEKQVNKYGIGYSIDASIDNKIINFINSLSDESINGIMNNLELIGRDELIDDNSKNIISKLENSLNI